jgi:HD-GYP domain-containing protein (c-di-GMP phosphodiesterase class II)
MSTAWTRAGIAALCLPTVAFAVMIAFPSLDTLFMEPTFHFYVVSGVALLAALACAALVVSGPVLRETRLLFLALAFLAIGGVFAVHGLMTPGHIADDFHSSLPASAWISAVAGAVLAALSVIDLPDRAERVVKRAGIVIFAWAAIAIAVYIALSFSMRDWLDWVPSDDRSVQYVLAFAAFALYAFATIRYTEAYAFARLPSQAAMVAAMALLTQVPPILLWGVTWYASWWIYHALYATAFAVLFTGWAIEVRRAGTLKAIADALSMRDALAQLDRGHDRHVLELVDAIEAKDIGTLGHVRRVGAYALAIGKSMNLAPQELRQLVLAAEMHDVGKIGVPDAILGKPGPLTEHEQQIMRQHCVRGYDIAGRVRALRNIAPVIRAHHERLDGSGYPDGLRGDDIPMLARIIAVADSYDAMTSHRPYRRAMTQHAAIAELQRVRTRELDPRCVDALIASFNQDLAAAA